MFSKFLCKTQFQINKSVIDTTTSLLFLHNHNHSALKFAFSKCFSTNQPSFAINYLINTCGLSPEIAISVSKRVKFETPHRPDSVLTFLSNHGFSKTQISDFVRRHPAFLLYNPEKTLLPKIEFYMSIGFSRSSLARILSNNPSMLDRSLDNHIIPFYNFLKSVLDTDERVFAALKRMSWSFNSDYSKNLLPNIEYLRRLGVPKSCVVLLLTHYAVCIMQRHATFIRIVEEIKGIGFDPKKSTFVLAVYAISGWKSKLKSDIYGRLGWSKDEIFMAFRKCPLCMTLSEKKIIKGMDYLVNKMGLPASDIARSPIVLGLSLEKRIIPRCSVIEVLLSKGLLNQFSLNTLLLPTEKFFFEEVCDQVFGGSTSTVECLPRKDRCSRSMI